MTLIATYLALGQFDMCHADIALGEDIHGHRNRHLIFEFHDETLVVDHVVVAMVDTATKRPVMELVLYHVVDGLSLRHVEIANPFMAVPIEVDRRERTGVLHLTVDATRCRPFWSVLLAEPSQRSERADLLTTSPGNPVEEIEVVAALRQQHRIALLLTVHLPAHIAMGVAVDAHALGVADRDNLTEVARVDNLLNLTIGGEIAQHMAQTDKDTFPAGCLGYLTALLHRLGYGLFQKDVIALADGSHARLVMCILRGADDNGIGLNVGSKEIFIGAEADSIGQSELSRHTVAAEIVGLNHGRKRHLFRVMLYIVQVGTHAVTCTYGYYFYY